MKKIKIRVENLHKTFREEEVLKESPVISKQGRHMP